MTLSRTRAIVLAGVLFALPSLPATYAQQGTPPLPRREYYGVFRDLYAGEYESAAKGLRSVSRGAYREGDAYFLDSVCYWTMLGECSYRLGDYSTAIEQFESALQLYSGLQAWSSRIDTWPEILEDSTAVRRAASVTWGVSTRGARYGKFDNSLLIRLGKTDAENEAAIRGGGTVSLQRLRTIDMAEVMRCVSLALYRRQLIKGPTCKIDPLTRQLATGLAGNGGATIPTAWGGIAKGIALASMEDWANAQTVLNNSLRIGGVDHPLTAIGLLELGHVAASQERWPEAMQLYMDASIAAAAFEQYDMIEEALHHAANVHVGQRDGTPFAPLAECIGWAKRERIDPLYVSLLADQAMMAAESGDAKSAGDALELARGALRGNDIARTSLYTRWLYASAHSRYVGNDVTGGDKAFAEFLQHAGTTSRWLYQIALADQAVRGNHVTERDADLLYAALLREPVEADWRFRPVESMAFIATPHFEPLEHWFEITLSRKAEEQAIEIAELIRRQRFFSALPMGGRLLALRWILEAPDSGLTDAARKQKQGLLIRYPAWKKLSEEAAAILAELEKMPFDPPNNSDDRVRHRKLVEQLSELTGRQETFLRKISLTREPCELAFPRPLSTAQVQQALRPNQLILSLLRIGDVYHVMTLGSGRYSIEGAAQVRELDRKILELLKQISVGEKSAVYDADVFAGPKWRETALEISKMLFQKSDVQSLAAVEELIVIPDGKAWYLPMELLQTGTAGQTSNLIDSVRIRYAPLASLAVPDERTSRRFQRRAVVAERNFNRDSEALIADGVKRLRDAMPELVVVERTFGGPSSLLAPTLDQLFVWRDNREKSASREGPLSIAPMQVDEGKPGSDLASWMALPWRGPDQLVWTGLSTDIEGSSRSRADGSELFFTSTALMGAGVRTILLSRWRVGGKSTIDLTREFAIDLNRGEQASAAWQRSVELFQSAEIDLASEPRVRPVDLPEPLTGEPPFFWAGYMVFDGGGESGAPVAPETDAPPDAEPDSGAASPGDGG